MKIDIKDIVALLAGIFLGTLILTSGGCNHIRTAAELIPTVLPYPTDTPPTHTPAPVITPEPTRTPTAQPQAENEILIRVCNIPVMTDLTKDEFNKDCLFCLHSPDRTRYVAIFHRFLWRHHAYHPEPGTAAWWPTWRIEGGDRCPIGAPPDRCDPMEEWHVYGSQPLYDTEAEFLFEWDDTGVIVTHEQTGNSQHVDIPGPFPILSEDDGCEPWGWHSPATAERIE